MIKINDEEKFISTGNDLTKEKWHSSAEPNSDSTVQECDARMFNRITEACYKKSK
jgi:hypothetical protein